MARGEPPGRTYTRLRPSASTYRPEDAKTYESSSTPTFGPGGGGAASARLQQDIDQIMPQDRSQAWGRALEQMYGFLSEQDTVDAVRRGDISPEMGAAIIAASVVPVPGTKGLGKAASQVARGAKTPLQRGRIAQQKARDLLKVKNAENRARLAAAEPVSAAAGPERPVPAARFPSGRSPSTDAPRDPVASGMPRRDLPNPPAASATAEAVDDGPIKLNIPQGLRGVDEASGNARVKVTWDGVKQPNHQQFKQWDAEAEKYVPWKEGFKQAKKRWKTRQTKSDVTNPNATPARVEQEVAGMTPQQFARYRMQQASAADPEGVAAQVGRANEADIPGVNRFDDIDSTMRQGPPGTNPRSPAKPIDPGQGQTTARGPRPERKPGESQEAFDARVQEWNDSRTVANLRKSRQSLKRPKQRKGESASAYKKRVDEWRRSLDEGSDTYGSTRASQVARDERARVDEKLRSAQPRAVDSSDPSLGSFRPNPMAPEYIPSGPSAAPVGRTFNPYDMPRYTPTRGKGSARLRDARKTAEGSPQSNVADKPAESVKKPSAKKKSSKKKSSKKKKDEGSESTATEQETTTQSADGRRVFAMRGRPAQARPGASTPLSRRPPDSVAPEGGFPMPRVPSRELVDPATTRTPVSSPYRRPESRPSRGRSTPLSERPEPKAPRGGFPAEGRKPATERGRKGYLTAGEEKAIKDRAKSIKAGGQRMSRGQKFAVGTVAAAFPAAAAASISQSMLRDAENKDKNMQQVAADAAEEAVNAEANDREPKTKAARTVLRDKYGRKITREEYNRREKYRERLKDMSPAERKAARKKEMDRREKWRDSIGEQLFGKQATRLTRNKDLREGVSSREVNAEMISAMGRSGNRQAARDVRKKYTRKKKD